MVYAIPHAKGEAMSLPPLPEKECLGENDWQEIHGHTAEQMREYGALCRKMALGEAAKLCDEVQAMYGQYTFSARVSAERIRELLNR